MTFGTVFIYLKITSRVHVLKRMQYYIDPKGLVKTENFLNLEADNNMLLV
ncbi:uncharacterized protein LOC126973058, partial [Leptidea sinapis]